MGLLVALTQALPATAAQHPTASPPDAAATYVTLERNGVDKFLSGNLPEAESSFRRAATARREVQGASHTDVAFSLELAAWSIYGQGRPEEARAMLQEALALCPRDDWRLKGLELLSKRPTSSPSSPDITFGLEGLWAVLRRQHQPEREYLAALATKNSYQNLFPEYQPDIDLATFNLAMSVFNLETSRHVYVNELTTMRNSSQKGYLALILYHMAMRSKEFGDLAHTTEIFDEYILVRSNRGYIDDELLDAADFYHSVERYDEVGNLLRDPPLDRYYPRRTAGELSFRRAMLAARIGHIDAAEDYVSQSIAEALAREGGLSQSSPQRVGRSSRYTESMALAGAIALEAGQYRKAVARLFAAGNSALERTLARVHLEPEVRADFLHFAFTHRDGVVASWLAYQEQPDTATQLLADRLSIPPLPSRLERQPPQPEMGSCWHEGR